MTRLANHIKKLQAKIIVRHKMKLSLIYVIIPRLIAVMIAIVQVIVSKVPQSQCEHQSQSLLNGKSQYCGNSQACVSQTAMCTCLCAHSARTASTNLSENNLVENKQRLVKSSSIAAKQLYYEHMAYSSLQKLGEDLKK